MRQRASLTRTASTVFLLIASLIVYPTRSHAAVTDVSITGGPANQTISLINEKGEQVGEGKTDDQGNARIRLIGAPLPGLYTFTSSGYRITRRLNDGANTISLLGLIPFAIATAQSLQFYVGGRWFDGALPFDGSTFLRSEYTGPGFNKDVFSLNPFFSIWGVPSVNMGDHKPYDHGGIYQDVVKRAYMLGLLIGLKHMSDLAKWGWTPPWGGRLIGNFNFGVGYQHTNVDMERLAVPRPEFTNAHGFNSTDNAFRWEFGFGIEWLCPAGWSVGLQKTNGFANMDILNGNRTVRADGSVALKLGYRWGGVAQ